MGSQPNHRSNASPCTQWLGLQYQLSDSLPSTLPIRRDTIVKSLRRSRFVILAALAASCTFASPITVQAADPIPLADSIPLKDLDGHFPFQPPESLEAWNTRRTEVLEQLAVSQGLLPKPTLAPVKPVVHGLQELDGYATAKVYFESLPGSMSRVPFISHAMENQPVRNDRVFSALTDTGITAASTTRPMPN